MTKVAVVEGGCRTDVSEQSSSVHRRPQTIGTLGHVGHDEVRVQMRIERSARAMEERCSHSTLTGKMVHVATRRSPHADRFTLEVGGRLGHGSTVGIFGGYSQFGRPKQVEHADGFRGTPHKIHASYGPLTPIGSQGTVTQWVEATQDGAECVPLRFAAQAKVNTPLAPPDARRLPRRPANPIGSEIVDVIASPLGADHLRS